MRIDLEDIMKAPESARERYAKWLGITCERREGENDRAYLWRFACACVRAFKRGARSKAIE